MPEIPDSFAVSQPTTARLRDAFAAAQQDPARGVLIDCHEIPTIPAALARWVLMQAVPDLERTITRVAFWHATVQGPLDLARVKLAVTPCFAQCQIGDGIDLTDAGVQGFEIIGGSVGAIRADRLTASGSVLSRGQRDDPTYCQLLPDDTADVLVLPHGILLSGAKIRGNLDLRGARIGPLADLPDGENVALLADGLAVEGNVLFADGFRADAEVRLNGSTVQRNLDCSGAQFDNPRGFSFSAAGIQVKGSVYLSSAPDKPTHSEGTIRLSGAKIDGDLDAGGAVLIAPAFVLPGWARVREPPEQDNIKDLDALLADSVKVGATIRLDGGFTACGVVRLVSAQIGNDLLCLVRRSRFLARRR